MAEPLNPDPEVVDDISDVVRAKVASTMRGAPVLKLPTTHEDSRSEEEASPAPRKGALKSRKVRTPPSYVRSLGPMRSFTPVEASLQSMIS